MVLLISDGGKEGDEILTTVGRVNVSDVGRIRDNKPIDWSVKVEDRGRFEDI